MLWSNEFSQRNFALQAFQHNEFNLSFSALLRVLHWGCFFIQRYKERRKWIIYGNRSNIYHINVQQRKWNLFSIKLHILKWWFCYELLKKSFIKSLFLNSRKLHKKLSSQQIYMNSCLVNLCNKHIKHQIYLIRFFFQKNGILFKH